MKRYDINDKVVFKYNNTNQIGIITNIRSQKDGGGYDIRMERKLNIQGHMHILIQY